MTAKCKQTFETILSVFKGYTIRPYSKLIVVFIKNFFFYTFWKRLAWWTSAEINRGQGPRGIAECLWDKKIDEKIDKRLK